MHALYVPSKLALPLLHPDINLPINSPPLAAQSLYSDRKLTTTGTGETQRTGGNQDNGLTSKSTETAESPLRCCRSPSRRGNAGLDDRPNFREISTHKTATIRSHYGSTPTRLKPPKTHMLLSNSVHKKPSHGPPCKTLPTQRMHTPDD